MSDLAAFDPVWEDIHKTRAHLADTLTSLRSAGLIAEPTTRPPAFKPDSGSGLWAYAFRTLRGFEDGCTHLNAVPVELILTGEVVAALCPDCDEQLPASLARPHGTYGDWLRSKGITAKGAF